jgi:hypothetical protein
VRWPQAATERIPAAILGENPCNRYVAVVASAAGVAVDAPGGDHLGKIGLKIVCEITLGSRGTPTASQTKRRKIDRPASSFDRLENRGGIR